MTSVVRAGTGRAGRANLKNRARELSALSALSTDKNRGIGRELRRDRVSEHHGAQRVQRWSGVFAQWAKRTGRQRESEHPDPYGRGAQVKPRRSKR